MSDHHGAPAAESIRLGTPGEAKHNEPTMQYAAASREFHFPYPMAYPIQLDLMRAVFRAIEDGQVGIFESPTGTGKSLSLICAACTWLQKNASRSQAANTASGAGSNGDEPDWVRQHAIQRQKSALQAEEVELKRRIARARQRQAHQRRLAALNQGDTAKKRSRLEGVTTGERQTAVDSDDEFLVDGYDNGIGGSNSAGGVVSDPTSYLSPAVLALMEKTGSVMSGSKDRAAKPFYARMGVSVDGDGHDGEEPETTPKLIYVSRTHSQLSQFVGELKRTSFGSEAISAAETVTTSEDDASSFLVRTITLGSRKQMCINASVRAMGERIGVEAMNDRCLELMKKKPKRADGEQTSQQCQYLPTADAAGQIKMLDFRDNAFTAVRDIEDIVALGKEMHTCPYFGARGGAKQAHLVAMPYGLLLSASARSSLNIDLKGSVVIVDEAHNLIDTILASHTVIVSDSQIRGAIQQVQTYLTRFATRLKGANEVNVKKLLSILNGLQTVCASHVAKRAGETTTVSAAELVRLIGSNADQVNLNELERWLRETKIARKMAGYADKRQQREQSEGRKSSLRSAHSVALSALRSIEALLLSLANRDLDGRIFISSAGEATTIDGEQRRETSETRTADAAPNVVTLKYQLLNPANVFSSIVQDARSVILAGGTMEPVSDFQTQLFPTLNAARLTRFSCKHIVPAQNLLSAVVGKGARGAAMDFKFNARSRPALLDELTATLTNYCSVIPHGVVVFVPSYAFLDTLKAHWAAEERQGPSSGSGLTRLAAKKRIFYEPKLAADVDTVLRDYGQAVEHTDGQSRTGGALLFAVVGAKLSEGINFSDRLARAVIMVGMPFANAKSPELVERMQYIRRLASDAKSVTSATAPRIDAGQELYVNLCMKAVNQSIGRAIRHGNDYAALIFLDARYARADIRGRLPQWIRESTIVYDSFGVSMAALGSFFRDKRAKEVC